MNRNSIIRREGIRLALLLLLINATRPSEGGILGLSNNFGDNTVYVTHDGGFGAPPILSGAIETPFVAPPGSPPFQFDSPMYGLGLNESRGKAGVAHYFNPTLANVRFAPGTGISQSAPDGGNGPASLEIDIDKIRWYTDMDGFGPAVRSSYYFRLTGTVGAGGYVQFILEDMQLGRVTFNRNWINTTPGPFDVVLTDALLSPGYGEIEVFDYKGKVTFIAKNDGEPSSIVWEEGMFGDAPVPEPAAMVLLCIGMLSAVLMAGQKRRLDQKWHLET